MLLFDLSSGRVVHDIRLDNVRADFALAWDLPGDRLYVVHGTGDGVTVVDLAEGRVIQEGTVEPRLSLGERVGRRLLPVVKAKFMPGINLQAAVSGNGTRLYVTGQRWEFAQLPDGTTSFRGTPLGLSVISTRDLTEQGRLDLPVDHLKLSPDGRYLLLAGAQKDITNNGTVMESEGSGLYVLNTARLQPVAHLQPDDTFTLLGFSPDGRHAYVSEAGDGGSYALRVLDLASRRFVAEREYGDNFTVYPPVYPLTP